MPVDNNNPKLLELTPAELVVPLKVTHAGRSYRLQHRLRPPAPADWFAYEAALEMAVEEMPSGADDEPCYRLHVRTSDAARLLWDRLALSVDGYDLPKENDWRALIPLAHKEAAVSSLTLVAPSSNPPSTIDDSTNNFFPLLADERVVLLEAARGGRAPRTLLPARLPGLVRLYDQLILSVEGYSIRNQPPASSIELIQAMDAWHKRVAVQALFGDLATAAADDNSLVETRE